MPEYFSGVLKSGFTNGVGGGWGGGEGPRTRLSALFCRQTRSLVSSFAQAIDFFVKIKSMHYLHRIFIQLLLLTVIQAN